MPAQTLGKSRDHGRIRGLKTGFIPAVANQASHLGNKKLSMTKGDAMGTIEILEHGYLGGRLAAVVGVRECRHRAARFRSREQYATRAECHHARRFGPHK